MKQLHYIDPDCKTFDVVVDVVVERWHRTQNVTFNLKSIHLLSVQCCLCWMYDVDSNISFLLPTRKLEALQQSSDHLSPETFCMSSFFIQLKPNYSFMGL